MLKKGIFVFVISIISISFFASEVYASTNCASTDAPQKKKKKSKKGPVVEFVTSGEGNTRDEAINNALRRAVEQTYGVYLTSSTDIINDEIMNDQIATVSSGNIYDYEVLSDFKSDNIWSVNIRALVSLGDLASYVSSKTGSAEINAEGFQRNVKLWNVNKENEIKALEILRKKIIREYFHVNYYDLSIKVDEPVYNPQTKNYSIRYTVKAHPNSNMTRLYNEVMQTIKCLNCNQTPPNGISAHWYMWYGEGYGLEYDNEFRHFDSKPEGNTGWGKTKPEDIIVRLRSERMIDDINAALGLSIVPPKSFVNCIYTDHISVDTLSLTRDTYKGHALGYSYSCSQTIDLTEEEVVNLKKIEPILGGKFFIYPGARYPGAISDNRIFSISVNDLISAFDDVNEVDLATIANTCLNGTDIHNNEALGIAYMFSAALKGDSCAAYCMWRLLIERNETIVSYSYDDNCKEYSDPIYFLKKAADLGHEYSIYNLGRIYYGQGKFSLAYNNWKKIVEKREMNKDFYLAFAHVCHKAGDYSLALKYLKKVANAGGNKQNEAEYYLALYYYGIKIYSGKEKATSRSWYVKCKYPDVKNNKSEGLRLFNKLKAKGYLKFNPAYDIMTADQARMIMKNDHHCPICDENVTAWKEQRFDLRAQPVTVTKVRYHEDCLKKYNNY